MWLQIGSKYSRIRDSIEMIDFLLRARPDLNRSQAIRRLSSASRGDYFAAGLSVFVKLGMDVA